MFFIAAPYSYLLVVVGCLGRVSAASADDFSSNLFSDIAPLIALFGEQVAKQYLSQSLGFLENLVFACAPLGILTAVTCAIRVGGPVALRALIGRAQEPAVQVELDLLRSTSSDVCELWDGRQVMRLTGSPEVVELVYDEENGAVYGRNEVMKKSLHRSWWRPFPSRKFVDRDFELQELDELVSESHTAPNISLNGGSIHINEVRLVALTALIIQTGVVFFFFFSVDNYDLSQAISQDPVPNSALPIAAAGALAVATGLFICTAVMEARTRITRWVPKDNSRSLCIMWLQKAQVLGDQHFQACAIFADKSRHEIVSSVYDGKRNLEIWTCLGAAVTAIGFVCQLIGLRQMHYTAAVVQLVATVIMSILRVVIRRHYSRRPVIDYDPTQPLNTFGIVELSDGQELSEVAKRLSRCKEWMVYSGFNFDIHQFSEEPEEISLAKKALHNRLRLKSLFGNFWASNTVTSLGIVRLVESLGNGIDRTIASIMHFESDASIAGPSLLNSSSADTNALSEPHWTIEVATIGEKPLWTKVKIRFERSGEAWKVDRSAIEAILGLWLAQLYQDGSSQNWISYKKDNLWLLPTADDKEYEIWQVMVEFLTVSQSQLIPVSDVMDACEQQHINKLRAFDVAPPSQTSAQMIRRAVISETDMFGMCEQYMMMSFLSQNAAAVKKCGGDLQLRNPIHEMEHLVLIQDPLFDEIKACLSTTTTFPADERLAFCILCKTGDFPDPLSLLPEILKKVTALEKSEATSVCSRIRKLLAWKVRKLLDQDLRAEAAETCLGVIGAFNEVFERQNAETRKLGDLVKRIMFKPASAIQETSVEIPLLPPYTETAGSLNASQVSISENEADGKALKPLETWNRDDLKSMIEAGDVEMFRMGLLFVGREESDILTDLLLKAFFSIQGSVTFERTEIFRLLILSGSGCETYRFDSRSLMAYAVEVGNIPLVELILKKQKVTRSNEPLDGLYLRRIAIQNGHEELVKFLFKFGDDVNVREPSNGMTALSIAALHGQYDIARYLISIGASVKRTTERGETALSFAARNNHEALGRLLIDQELKESSRHIDSNGVGFQYERNRTSLHLVAAEGNMNLAMALLDVGWDLNGGECAFTPVLDAIYHDHEHVAKFLIQEGSRIDQELLRPAADHGLIDLTRILLSKGVDVNALSNGQSALEVAVITRHKPEMRIEMVKLLLENGANVTTSRGKPLVLRAAMKGYSDVSVLLIEAGAPLDGERDGGATVVHYSAEYGYLDVIRALVAKGAELDVQDNNGHTPLHLAAEKGHADIISALLEAKSGDWVDRKNNAKCTPLHDAVINNNVDAARVLVEQGASITSQTYSGYVNTTPLSLAVRDRHAEIVQLFIEKGATLDQKIHGDIVKTAIDGGDLPTIKALLANMPEYATQAIGSAVQRSKFDVVKLLLELGADITDGDALRMSMYYNHGVAMAGILFNHNRSAQLPVIFEIYHKAVSDNKVDEIRFWLENGVPIGITNKHDETALHVAARMSAVEALTTLLEVSSAPEFVNARNDTGATALYTVIDKAMTYQPEKTLQIIRLLVEHGADYRIGVDRISSLNEGSATPRGYALSLGLSDVVAFFDEVDKRQE